MFHYLTQDIKEPFLRQELVDRLAAMLNYNLKQLSGSKCKNLKVRNSEKYNWDPKWLLSHLVDIYLHLDSDILAAAMAIDQRSFSMETFQVIFNQIQSISCDHVVHTCDLQFSIAKLVYLDSDILSVAMANDQRSFSMETFQLIFNQIQSISCDHVCGHVRLAIFNCKIGLFGL